MRKNKMLGTALIVVAIGFYTGCISSEKPSEKQTENQTSTTEALSKDSISNEGFIDERGLAAQAGDLLGVNSGRSYIVYYSAKVKADRRGNEEVLDEIVEVFTPARWRKFPERDSARRQKIIEFYFANTRERSDSGRRNVACFTGDATEVIRQFFNTPDTAVKDFSNFILSHSSDRLAIGVQFTVRKQGKPISEHFRLPSCTHAGKNYYFNPQVLARAILAQEKKEAGRTPQAFDDTDKLGDVSDKMFQDMVKRMPASFESEGYRINDQVTKPLPDSVKVPQFVLKADFDHAHRVNEPFPWRQKNLNLSNPSDALEFALILKKYAYDGMGNQSRDPSMNLIAARANKFWCHMPWLNQGPSGREAIHGLTQERALQPSTMYPDASPGSDWGVAVFNFMGCRVLDRVFGPANSPRALPETPQEWQKRATFEDGTVTAKFLFTTAKFPSLNGAWEVIANVSPPNSNARSPRDVRHLQLDIGVKDSRLRGVPLADGWVMLTYYYDANYNETFDIGANMPEGIRKMRPSGIQFGFGPQGSIIFPGALANSKEGLLNGPADNPASSCLGCHGVAGTSIPMAPGIESMAQYKREKKKGLTLDFGQQFAFARRYYETRAKEEAK